MKKIMALFLVLALTLSACLGGSVTLTDPVDLATQPATESMEDSYTELNEKQSTVTVPSTATIPSTIAVDYDSDDLDADVDSTELSTITLDGNLITVDGSGVMVDGTIITITSAGTYSIHGTLDDGQIIVDTEDKETVVLVLNGVELTSSTSAPIYVLNADKTVITLADGTENFVTDGNSYILTDAEADEPNAAIFSNDDLTINGSGALTVNAVYNNGIASKDDLKITDGIVTVNAANDGIKGRDSVAVKDGIITVNAGGDGIQANNNEDAEAGYVAIEGGTLTITAGLDGIQAETQLVVSDGNITIISGGGSVNSTVRTESGGGQRPSAAEDDDGTTESAKGLSAGVAITITGGSLNIDSSDDTIHSNDSLTIDAGTLVLAAGDDGLHSDTTLVINGGDLNITKSYEGLESASITLNGGTVRLVSSDDGINAVSGTDGAAMTGRQGPGGFGGGNNFLYINGGTIVVDALGDGLDVNGSIMMSGGVVIVSGPTNNGNGALDYDGVFEVTGGFLVAAGSSGMAQAPSTSSTQYSVMVTLSSPQVANTMIHLETADGQDILTFVPGKDYQSVVLCSPELENGSTYVVYTGGSSTGTVVDGLVTGGVYTAGAELDSFTIESMVTGVGTFGGGMMGGRPGGGMRP